MMPSEKAEPAVGSEEERQQGYPDHDRRIEADQLLGDHDGSENGSHAQHEKDIEYIGAQNVPQRQVALPCRQASLHEACASRDQLADDHVLLQAEERVGCRTDRRARQHLDGVLEGGSREERVGAEGGLGHAQQDFRELGGLLAFASSCSLILRISRRSTGRRAGTWYRRGG
jgi:hypothetical protein